MAALERIIRKSTGIGSLCSHFCQMNMGKTSKIIGCTVSRPAYYESPLSSYGNISLVKNLHTSSSVKTWDRPDMPKRFLQHNEKVYPPTPFGEKERPAFVCHLKPNIKYSPKKMWFIASLIRGMKIDDAINQLKFIHKKGAVAAIETLQEAQALAVKEHNLEYKSNLWVSEAFVNKGIVIKGIRRHARRRMGEVRYMHCHLAVTLEEGEPPEHYYPIRKGLSGEERLQEWLDELRQRKIGYTI